nr:hypothetical protein GCM10020093_085020 [Planobispora longispora]
MGPASLVDATDPEDQALNAAAAQAAITFVDTAIQTVSDTRARLGAVRNRFEHMITSLHAVIEGLSAPESRIRDTGAARQVATSVRDRIVPQAGASIPAQANQAPQSVLRFLG